MKVAAYTFAAGAVALSATALAMPTFFKRVANQAFVFSCFTQSSISGIITPDCQAAAALDVGIITMVSVDNLHIGFGNPNDLIMDLSSTAMHAQLYATGFTWPVTDTAQNVTIVDNGVAIATFLTPTSPATVDQNNKLDTIVGNCALNVIPGQENGFSAFLSSLISKPEYTFTLKGSVDATLSITTPSLPSLPSFGGAVPAAPAAKTLPVKNIGFSSPITLKACNNFPQITYVSQDGLTKDATGVYTLTSTVNIFNPSQLVLSLGDMTFNTVDKTGLVVGLTVIKNMNLNMGDNILTAITTSSNENVYNALTTGSETFIFTGFVGSSPDKILGNAMVALKTSVVVPQLKGL